MKKFLEVEYDIWNNFDYRHFVQSSIDFEIEIQIST
jgi:hypothetical protein